MRQYDITVKFILTTTTTTTTAAAAAAAAAATLDFCLICLT